MMMLMRKVWRLWNFCLSSSISHRDSPSAFLIKFSADAEFLTGLTLSVAAERSAARISGESPVVAMSQASRQLVGAARSPTRFLLLLLVGKLRPRTCLHRWKTIFLERVGRIKCAKLIAELFGLVIKRCWSKFYLVGTVDISNRSGCLPTGHNSAAFRFLL